jgi:hypothetical protein
MAKELDAYDAPEAFDLAGKVPPDAGGAEVPRQVRSQRGPGGFDAFKTWVLRSISLFTSMSCAVTSVYFSNIWFIDSQPPAIAAVMSLSVVATLTVAPELAVSLARKRKMVTAVAIVLISVIATLFSMSSTIGGIYNARTIRITESETESAMDTDAMAAGAEVDLLKAKIERLSRSMETDQGAVATYQAAIDTALAGGMAPGSREMQLFVANRNAAVARVRTGEQSIADAERRIAELLVKSVEVHAGAGREVRLDFALWLGDRFGMTADQMEFMLAVFPAVFIDMIAPAMLVVAFAL